jgi:parvulin-like peptidyl-prolyl isomerase
VTKRFIVLVAVLAIVAAACSDSSEPVASVGDVDISRTEVEGLVRSTEEDVTATEFASFLSIFIQWEAVEQAANAEFGIDPTDEQVQQRLDQLVAESGTGDTLEAYLDSVNASEVGIRKYATQLVIQEEVELQLTATFQEATAADAEAEIARDPLTWTEVCAAHILVATPEEAVDVTTRLAAGEDFAAIAANVSIDPGSGANGGDLGCASPSQYVPAFAEATMSAEIGVPTEPVVSDFGSHIILVESRETADPVQVLAYLNSLAERDVVDGWFLAVIASSNVTVIEDVGVWVTEPVPQVLPPA